MGNFRPLRDRDELVAVLATVLDRARPRSDYRLVGTGAALLQGVTLPTGDIDVLVADRADVDRFAAALDGFPCLDPPAWLAGAEQYFAHYVVDGVKVGFSTVEYPVESDAFECAGEGPWRHSVLVPCAPGHPASDGSGHPVPGSPDYPASGSPDYPASGSPGHPVPGSPDHPPGLAPGAGAGAARRWAVPAVRLELRLLSELVRGRPDRSAPLIDHLRGHGADLDLIRRGLIDRGVPPGLGRQVLDRLRPEDLP
ncbi:hypothetical protein [Pseudosporangium ferrugineum]|uniref:Nucleotidyltransferase AbiEii toxin of type IV toxin-antitoxin system n=1 Tax=Pseudosporangium ferrugineum TaxID=439699 RepID=A0A2T0SII7_9ACTN|nr:hypothetical protein [Pseudosporangium ferrugineum]PRY33230.1 hypothetical protein CLV70_101392 [Pseudosporangium ferrugineum]